MTYQNLGQPAPPALLARPVDLSGTVMRVSLGLIYLAHGPLLKASIFGMSSTAAYFETLGLPGGLAFAVMFAELAGGLCLLFGIWSRQVALAMIPILVGSIVYDHGANGWLFSSPGGGWEYSAFLIAASVAVALSDGGAYTLDGADDA